MALAVLLCLEHPVGGFIGMSGFLTYESGLRMVLAEDDYGDGFDPFFDTERPAREQPVRAQEYERELLCLDSVEGPSSERTARRTPVLLGHGAENEKVPIRLREAAAEVMRTAGYCVDWKRYENQGHWYKIPDQIDDILNFILQIGWKMKIEDYDM